MTVPGAKQMVVTYHPIATQIGYDILNRGGNAFDAFVASTAAEYVLSEGVTSLAGPLAALLYDSKMQTSIYLDAGFNEPINARQKWDAKRPKPGAAALVPGAVAGLEAISKKYGNLSFKEALAPAIKLAENGFPVNRLYAALIRNPEYSETLKRSEYGQKTFFREGQPLKEGDTLKLPEVAQFLTKLVEQGSQYVYTGAWAKECLKTVNSAGGHLQPEDFSRYQAEWKKPWLISYRGYDIASPQNTGGLNTALALKVLEQTDLTKFGSHFSKSADALEILTRIKDEVDHEPGLYDYKKYEDPEIVSSIFSLQHTSEIWRRVQEKLPRLPSADSGSHSYHIIVVDRDGNAVTGTNTIESFPWGKGLFVEGIPLTASGMLPFATKPGHRRITATSMQIGTKNGKLRFAAGAFSFSLLEAEFQFIVNLVDYGLSAQDAVELPRFGNDAWDIQSPSFKKTGARWLDPRISPDIVEVLDKRGLKFTQYGFVDTGDGAVAVIREDGNVEGAMVPLSTNGVKVKPDLRAGIGAALDFTKDHAVVLSKVFPGSPAAKAGLNPGDIVVTVQATDTSLPISTMGLGLQDVINLIKGAKGTKVILSVRKPSGKIESLEVVREELTKANANLEGQPQK